MAEKTLETLFHETLKDIYYAERKILKALPKMMKAATSPDLKAVFEKHRNETATPNVCSRFSRYLASAPKAKLATLSRASYPRARKSWMTSKVSLHSMPASPLRRRPSNTTK